MTFTIKTPSYSYRSYRYQPDLMPEDDTIKIWHEIVLPGGARIHNLPWSPYHRVSEAEFIAYIDANYPITAPAPHPDMTDYTIGAPNIFTYHPSTQTITAEASTISAHYNIQYQAGNTITIYNPKTGRHMSFMLNATTKRYGSILKWTYIPVRVADAIAHNVSELIIFND